MTNLEFNEQFTRLVECFNVAKPDAKARIYYQELGSQPLEKVKFAVNKAIREKDTFPSIAWLLATISALPQDNAFEKIDCAKCNGSGFVVIGKKAYRARCEHGAMLSKKIALAPESEYIAEVNQKVEFAKVYGEEKASGMCDKPESLDWLDQMQANPERFLKGFKLVHNLMKKGNPALYEKVRALMIDFYGPEQLKKRWPTC